MRIATSLTAALLLVVATTPSSGQEVVTITDVIDGGSGGLALDGAGNIYIGDFGPDLGGHGTRVFRSTPGGDVSVFATGFDGASGNDFDSQGNLFQSNINAWRIDKIAPDGTVTPFTSNGIFAPVGIAIDENDDLYVCNCGTNNIRKVTAAGVSTLFASSALFACPNGITFGDDGNLYVANFQNGLVLKVLPDGTVQEFADVPGDNNGHITYFDGYLYVAGRGANKIFQVTLDGTVVPFAGNGERGVVDGPKFEASFSLPNDLIVDPTGTYMYVNDVVGGSSTTDTSPMVLRRIDMTPIVDVDQDQSSLVPMIPRAARPNPFRSSTTLAFAIERSEPVELAVYDVTGRAVRTLVDASLGAGEHERVWNGRDDAGRPVAPGVYFYRVATPSRAAAGRVELLR